MHSPARSKSCQLYFPDFRPQRLAENPEIAPREGESHTIPGLPQDEVEPTNPRARRACGPPQGSTVARYPVQGGLKLLAHANAITIQPRLLSRDGTIKMPLSLHLHYMGSRVISSLQYILQVTGQFVRKVICISACRKLQDFSHHIIGLVKWVILYNFHMDKDFGDNFPFLLCKLQNTAFLFNGDKE